VEKDAATPTSQISTTTVPVTRNTDILYFPWTLPPQEMSVYVAGIDRGTAASSAGRYFQFGDLDGNPRLFFSKSTTNFLAHHNNGTGSVSLAFTTPWKYGDKFEILVNMDASGALAVTYTVNNGPEIIVGTAAAPSGTLSSAWSGQKIFINQSHAGSNVGGAAYTGFSVATGTQTMTQMRVQKPFTGYADTHFRFRRDTRLGTRRHQYLGSLNTDDTTIDGKPAVEIISSAGDILVVSSGKDPVQGSTDSSGPILNVE
jgi:hypothetical protein